MLVFARAPVRIGVAGGGSDLVAWTRERPGRCLSLAINRHTAVAVMDRDDNTTIASYMRHDHAAATTELANGLVRETALHFDFENNIEVHTMSQLTSRGSGLGVSSSIAVSLAAAFARMRRMVAGAEEIGDDPQDISNAAAHVEITKLRRPIGRQDHAAAAHGGLRLYAFEGADAADARVERTFSADDARWVAAHLLLVALPEGHDSRAILSNVQRAEQVRASYDAVPLAIEAIEKRNAALLGRALDMCHLSKKTIPGAVPKTVAEIVERLQCDVAGVRGCKVAGAGGGGHLVVCCEPGTREALEREIGLPASAVEPDLRGVRSEGWL